MSLLSKINPFGSKTPSAPPAEVEEEGATSVGVSASTDSNATLTASVEKEDKQEFEWNTSRLFKHNPDHSKTRTWTVRVLSVLLLPLTILTLIVDAGRIAAHNLGLVNGKSYSLIDKTSGACKALSEKVSNIFKKLGPKPLTIEQLNQKVQKNIEEHAAQLIDGYKSLNGGFFHTSQSFSSSHAMNAERKIQRAQVDLVNDVHTFIGQNSASTEAFSRHFEQAKAMVMSSINAAAGDEVYIENKIERKGPRPALAFVAGKEFLQTLDQNQDKRAVRYIALAKNAPQDMPASLKKGVDAGVITKEQAENAVTDNAPNIYEDALENGLDPAEKQLSDFIQQSVKEGLVTKEVAKNLSENIDLSVSQLATAAAKDIVKELGEDASDVVITQKVSKASDELKQNNRFSANKETQFISETKEEVERIKNVVSEARKEQEALDEQAKEEAEKLKEVEESQRVAEVKAAADQSNLLKSFMEMLGLVSEKQQTLNGLYREHVQLNKERKEITKELSDLQEETVLVNNKKHSVLEAANVYSLQIRKISEKRLTDTERRKQIRDLVNQGFPQKTLDKITKLQTLTPRVEKVINEMAELSEKAQENHLEALELLAVYNVYKKNNKSGLTKQNSKSVSAEEEKVFATQKNLNGRYNELLLRSRLEQLRGQPKVVVNEDPNANKSRVDALLKAREEAAQVRPDEESEKDILKQPNFMSRLSSGVFNAATWPVRAPYNFFFSSAKTEEELKEEAVTA